MRTSEWLCSTQQRARSMRMGGTGLDCERGDDSLSLPASCRWLGLQSKRPVGAAMDILCRCLLTASKNNTIQYRFAVSLGWQSADGTSLCLPGKDDVCWRHSIQSSPTDRRRTASASLYDFFYFAHHETTQFYHHTSYSSYPSFSHFFLLLFNLLAACLHCISRANIVSH